MTTGATDVWLVKPLLLRAFVMMNFVITGAAVETGAFLVICPKKQNSSH